MQVTNCNISFVKTTSVKKYTNDKLINTTTKDSNLKLVELRKNLIAKGTIYSQYTHYLITEGTITDKDVVLLNITTPIIICKKDFETNNNYQKLKYNFVYMEDVIIEEKKSESKYKSEFDLVHPESNTSQYKLATSRDNNSANLGDHNITFTARAKKQKNVFEGPVTIVHSEHNKVVYGEEGGILSSRHGHKA